MSEITRTRVSVLSLRFSLIGSLLGVLVGLGEAVTLSTKPSPPVFLETDTSPVIWFLAPLAGLCVLGLAGFVLALAAASLDRWFHSAPAWLASAGIGFAVVYFGAVMGWLHAGGKGWFHALTRGDLGVWFLVGLLGALGILRLGSKRAARPLDAEQRWSPAPLLRCLGLALAVCLAGLIHYRWVHSNFGTSGGDSISTQSNKRPNIVLITLDTVRADHLSSYGYHRLTTPNLDRWAREGVLFDNAIAPSSWTLATHATLFTGLLPHQHGANLASPLYPGPLPLAKILQSNGYETAGFSSNLSYGFAGWGMSQGFSVYGDDSVSVRHNLVKSKVGRHLLQPAYERLVHFDDYDRRNAEELNGDVLRWFRRRSTRPFFLFINYYDAHLAYFAPPPFQSRFGIANKPSMREIFLAEDGRLPRPLSAPEMEALTAGYDNCLAYLDEQVGKLLRMLASSPGWANTIVFITSDHGEAFGEHERYGHGWDLHREVLHVPLIILGPGVPKNQRIAHIARIREIFPTVIDMALDVKAPLSRVNLSRFWTPDFQPEPLDEFVMSELSSGTPDFQPVFASLMTPEWHYIHDSSGQPRLYRYMDDPLERLNLARDPELQGTLRELHQQLLDHVGSSYQPWRGPEYLLSLDGPGYSFPRRAIFNLGVSSSQGRGIRRIGTSQIFYSKNSTAPRRLNIIDEELLQSLPYH